MKVPRFEPFVSYQENVLSYAFDTTEYPNISVDELLRNLNPNEKHVFERYVRDHLTQTEIALELGKSHERVRQILVKALRKVKYSANLINEKLKINNAINNFSYDPDDPEFILTLDLSVRAFNCLYRAQVCSFNQIKKAIETGELWNIRNLGPVCAKEIIEKFNSRLNDMREGRFIPDFPTNVVEPTINSKISTACDEFRDIGFSERAFNSLVRADIYTLDKLVEVFVSGDIFAVRDLGSTSIQCIHKFLFKNKYIIVNKEN